MTSLAGWITGILLSLVALVHVYWGLGGLWPARSEAALVRTVIGMDADNMPPLWITWIVAALIMAAGGFGFLRGVLGLDSFLFIRVPLAVLSVVFVLRGILPYLPLSPMSTAVEPFRSLNLYAFSPLILLLAACFLFLLVRR